MSTDDDEPKIVPENIKKRQERQSTQAEIDAFNALFGDPAKSGPSKTLKSTSKPDKIFEKPQRNSLNQVMKYDFGALTLGESRDYEGAHVRASASMWGRYHLKKLSCKLVSGVEGSESAVYSVTLLGFRTSSNDGMNRGANTKYNVRDMQIGDSFEAPLHMRNGISGYAKRFGIKFRTEQLEPDRMDFETFEKIPGRVKITRIA